MRRKWLRAPAGASACLAALLALAVTGAEPPPAERGDETTDLDDRAALAGCIDPAFDRRVDLGLVGLALNDNDAATMADTALQLAEAERVLQRALPALSADVLFRTAAAMAAANHDKATLERLAKAAAARGDKDWAGRVAAAQKLAGEARDAAPDLRASVETTTVEQYEALSKWLRGFRQATTLGDEEHLQALGEAASLLDGLDARQQEELGKKAEAARKMMEGMAPAELLRNAGKRRALKALAAASRGWGLPHVDVPTPHLPDVKLPPVHVSPDPINVVQPVIDAGDRFGHAWTKKVRDPVVNIENAPGKALAKGQRSFDDERARIPLPYDGADMAFIQTPGGTAVRNYPLLTVTAPNGGYVGDGMWGVYVTRRPRATFAFQVLRGQARVVIARARMTDDVVLEQLYAGKWCTAGYKGKEWVEDYLPPLPSGDEAYCALLQLGGNSRVNVLGLVTQVVPQK